MRKVFLLVAILFLNKIGFAQTIISGFIKDNRNHPINGASITIKDSYDGATTDSSGKFHFATAGFQKLSKKKNASWGINYGYTNVYLAFKVLKTKPDYFQIPEYANLVLKKFVTKLKTQFNTNYVFATGRPYYNIQYDYNNNKFSIADQGKTIPYNSLSFSINYLPDIFKKDAKKFTVFVFSITNVLGSRQVFGYNYSYNGHRKEAIVPPTKTFIYLGAFFSFGVDRTQNAINNNL